jgi:hypothetical protein
MSDEKSLIEDVADNIERCFKEMWVYQDQQTPMKARENVAIIEMTRDLALTKEELDGKAPEERERIEKVRAREAAEQIRLVAATAKVREVSGLITDELSRLTEDTYPRSDPATPERMYDFLMRFSKAYTKQGKQRSAGPILEYLYSACDHAYWLWREWIASCMAVGDHASAERLLAVLTDSSASSSQAHHFNAEGGRYKATVVIAKGLIALKRDGDIATALKYAEVARLTFAEQPEAIGFYHAINYVKQEVDAGNLQLSHLQTGRNGSGVRKQLDTMIPKVALLTGKWTEEE